MIKVGFSYRKGNVMSWLIRKLTSSDVSHTWLAIVDPYFGDETLIMEAGFAGWQMVSYQEFLRKNTIVTIVEPVVPLNEGLRMAARWLGSPYDITGLFGAFIVVVGHWFKRKWKNPLDNPKSMFCSEAIIRILQISSYPRSQELDPGSTTPKELLQFLSSMK